MPHVTLDEAASWRFLHGAQQPLAGTPVESGRVAVFAGERLLGIGSLDGGVLSPNRVIPDEAVGS
ncbi:MAG: tRNA pseudouridine(55) synthase TruB [Chloroflexi bacterium]|nr:tRNA pseudouridine(55) synthase TruB [Chloroflexota bacterium]